MKQNVIRHGRKLTVLAASAALAACGGGGEEGGAAAGGAAQNITFKYPGGGTLLSAPVKLTATADSGLPVTFKSGTPEVCTVSGDQLSLLTAAECLVIASQAGGASADGKQWAPADDVSQLFVVLKKPQVVTFAPPDYLLSSQATSVNLSAAADSGLPVTFKVDTPDKCSISGSTLTLLGKGSCAVTATQAGNEQYAPQSMQRFIAVDPLVVADGFKPVAGGRAGGSSRDLRTKQDGGVTAIAWNNTVGWDWCGAENKDWCYHEVSPDGSTLTSALELPVAKVQGWTSGFSTIELFVPNKTSFNSSGDTTGGVRVTSETSLGFGMGINPSLYSSGRPIQLSIDLGKRNGSCNVELSTLLWPRQPGMLSYSIPLANFAVTDNCGLAGVAQASRNDEVRKLPNPYNNLGEPVNQAAFDAALNTASMKAARDSAASLLSSSDIIRLRWRLWEYNSSASTAVNGLVSSTIHLGGAITIR